MLLKFSVKNFRSFKDEQTIDFTLASGERIDKSLRFDIKNKNENIRVLKNALIYGANASGKSNVIDAIFSLASIVIYPTLDITEKFMADTFGYNGYPIEFKIKLATSNSIYNYEITFTEDEIVFEKLDCNGKMIFIRNYQEFDHASLNSKMKGFLNQSVRKNALMLHAAQAQNLPHSTVVFQWLSQFNNYSDSYYTDLLVKNQSYKEKILYGLKLADFNITDIIIEKIKEDNKTSTHVYLVHKNDNKPFRLNLLFESTGTQQYFGFLLRLFDPNKNQVILMDEFDRAIHKTLAHSIVRLLNSQENDLQFISTTHDSTLMDLLKKHQIYFVEKNTNGESEIFSLSDFDDVKLTRKDARFSPRYEEGLYGANQIVNEAGLLALLTEAKDGEN